ncbi:MAG: hypothetical protein AABX47_04000 [Nanoarchaeota archaeon]
MKEPKQEIKEIEVSELHLWSENPRDPIESDIGDLEIIKRAIKDDSKKWNISKFIETMGTHYDFSELPTVVLENNKYIVYDGNRRIAILKYLQNQDWAHQIEGKLFPSKEPPHLKGLSKIPCNICDKSTALINIERKHVSNGTWKQLERDYFEHNFRGKEKSLFLKFEEATGLISQHPELNENIMKNNILTENKLKEIGFLFDKNGNFLSVYDENTAKSILDNLANLKVKGTISSRGDNKYDIKTPLTSISELKDKIKPYKDDNSRRVTYVKESSASQIKRTQRQNKMKELLFGGALSLKDGVTNDLYRDVGDLHQYFERNKEKLSNTFPNLIRMALRLLVESATDGKNKESIDNYIKSNFLNAKNKLSQDQKTNLSTQEINTDTKLLSLLHTGGHSYSSSSNIEQTLAMSVIVGKMLEITHGRKNK